MRIAGLVLALVCAATAGAQDLAVSLSPFSPAPQQFITTDAVEVAIAAFRFEATGSAVVLEGLVLAVHGTGSFAKDLEPTDGIQLWQDDGDGVFDTGSDYHLCSAPGASPTVTLSFLATVGAGQIIDIWAMLRVKDLPRIFSRSEFPQDRTFAVSIDAPSDVDASGASVFLTAPAPTSSYLTVSQPPSQGASTDHTCSASATGTPHAMLPVVTGFLVALVGARRRRPSTRPSPANQPPRNDGAPCA